jgi:hypothetical protein
MRLSQFLTAEGDRRVAATLDDGRTVSVPGVDSVYELASAAIAAGDTLAGAVEARLVGSPVLVDLARVAADKRFLAPLDHPDPAHLLVSGTGLTHLGSAEGRDKMHKDLADPSKLTDSMKMFRLGLTGGKPAPGTAGVAPEWFYKGDGSIVAAPEADLESPDFALDGGEEPEIVGLYLIGPDGTPWRVGFALGNEFSDHVTERQNYLYLAHSKLRACSFGPEILLGPLPADVRGTSRIRRGGTVLWEKPFLSGEDNMSHSIANLEAHHFKYAAFRRPGDVHVHYFGTATLSFSDGIRTEPGDVFEIAAAPFGLPLRNRLSVATAPFVQIHSL